MTNMPILIVEDDEGLREALSDTLELAGYSVLTADCGEDALIKLQRITPSLIVSDINMPGLDGHALLKNIRKDLPEVPIILMTAFGTISNAVEAMRQGAVEYLTKPFAPEVLVEKVKPYVGTAGSEDFNGPVVADPISCQLMNLAQRVAKTEATVMVSGPSGAGKEVLAQYIHQHSSRANQAFVAINCAAIPENMLEATLFGYEKGAYTGAHQACAGKFEQAQNGSLFLDEIGEMDLGLQAKLLRVLQEREVERLGSRKSIQLNVRVIAATNKDLKAEVEAGRFREDLYYRLNVFPLNWKALCERPGDIMPIAEHLLEKYARQMGRALPEFSEDARQVMDNYDWPGNVREMDNVIQRALILLDGDIIYAEDLMLEEVDLSRISDKPPATSARSSDEPTPDSGDESCLGSNVKNHEFQLILDALKAANGSRKVVAEKLGISPRTLRYKLAKMRENGIEVPDSSILAA